ncbi:hypothetical protein [Yoonia sp. SS1-5]|uniref:Uncharacterized protein n=1 Tax=Yoonia rhodophyticola TaxID=3137370 RepID=A0AAN0NJ17_9RHOB
MQAAISGLHAQSPTWEDTDWPQISALYALLYQIQPSVVVRINQAMAVSYAHSVSHAIALLDSIADDPQIAGYQPYHTARADLLERAGDRFSASESYVTAIALTDEAPNRAFLQRKLDALSH